VEIFVMYT